MAPIVLPTQLQQAQAGKDHLLLAGSSPTIPGHIHAEHLPHDPTAHLLVAANTDQGVDLGGGMASMLRATQVCIEDAENHVYSFVYGIPSL